MDVGAVPRLSVGKQIGPADKAGQLLIALAHSDAYQTAGLNCSELNSDMDIYHHFFERGLTDSHRHFSSAWLGRAENYLCLRAGRGPSSDALIELFQTLWREGKFALAARVAWAVLWLKPEARR